MSTIPILTPAESAAWDKRAEHEGIALEVLMENAGRGSAAVLLERFGNAARRGVLVAAGPGHNGGDGWVLARSLHALGIRVFVASTGESAPLTAKVAERSRASGVRVVAADGPWPQVGLLVDALLGTGAKGAPKGGVADLLARLHDLPLPIVALDGPTGLDLGSGLQHGAPRADLTITFGGLRRGHLLSRDEVGGLVVIEIGHSPADPKLPTLVTDDQAASWLPRLRAKAHKGERGRVVLVGGAPGMSGALRLGARAAFAGGAGLVFTLSPPESAALIAGAEPDVQARVWDGGVESEELRVLLGQVGSLVVGPGLGRVPETRARISALLASASASASVVLDADALTVFGGAVGELKKLLAGRTAVLTPHLGEFRTLFPAHAAIAEQDPWSAAASAAKESGAVVLLKGVPTVIAHPDGQLLTVAAGNPGLATGGSGDILSGLIGAALAAGVDPFHAAALGAQALGRAGDLAARRYSARAMRPMDVVAAFPDLWRAWELRGAAAPTPRAPILFELEKPRTA
jgi:hydroxyethylthiazole kinase-like uncharacterized protein yjeF